MKKILLLFVSLLLLVISFYLYSLVNFIPKNSVFYIADRGRIGNQLFQYSAAYAFSKKTKRKLIIFSKGRYALHDLSVNHAKIIRLNKFNDHLLRVVLSDDNKLFMLIKKLLKIKSAHIVNENNFFTSLNSEIHDNIELRDYFESPIFFNEYKNELLKQFSFKNINQSDHLDIIKKINNKNSYCLHVRRGDMVGNKGRETSIKFQKKAIELVKFISPQAKFFVFSDSPESVLKELHGYEFEIMPANSAITDLFLMSQCGNNIITKSSFSWWGAFLNQSNPKVIAPYQAYNEFFFNEIKNLKDRYAKRVIYDYAYPENWILLNEEYKDLRTILESYINDQSFIEEVLVGYEPKKFDLYLADGTELKIKKHGKNITLCNSSKLNDSAIVVSEFYDAEENQALLDMMNLPFKIIFYINGEENAIKLRKLRKNHSMVLIDKVFINKPNIADFINHIIKMKPYNLDYIIWNDPNNSIGFDDFDWDKMISEEKISIKLSGEPDINNLDKKIFDNLLTGDVRAWEIYNYLFFHTKNNLHIADENKIISYMLVKYPDIFRISYDLEHFKWRDFNTQ